MKKKVLSFVLALCLLMGCLPLSALAEQTFLINGKSVSTSTGQSLYNCSTYASEVLRVIWNDYNGQRTVTTTFNSNYNMLKGKSASNRSVTPAHTKEFIQAAPLGSRIRVCAASDTSTNNYDNTTKGHTMVLVAKDNSAGKFTVLESGWGAAAANTYTYNSFVDYFVSKKGYGYFFYIADLTPFASTMPSTPNYGNIVTPTPTPTTPNPVAPNPPSVSVNGTSVTVSWNDVANETGYDVYLVQSPWRWEDIKHHGYCGANWTSATFSNVAYGNYQAFVIARPNADNVQSGWTAFSVKQPETQTETLYPLTVIGYVDGTAVSNFGNYATFDVYVNDKLVADNVSHYHGNHPKGSSYRVKDVNVKPGYTLDDDFLYVENRDRNRRTVETASTFPVAVNTKLVATAKVSDSSVNVSWNSIPGASEYDVVVWPYVDYKAGMARSVKSRKTNSTSCVFEDIPNGKYLITISTYNGKSSPMGLTTDQLRYECADDLVITVDYSPEEQAETDTSLDPTPENSFIDVPNGAYFAEAVNWAVDKGITAGTSSNTFSPNQVCTRAQAVTFLWRAAGSPEPSGASSKFVDVASGQYYTKAVQWAVEKGITGGTSANTFGPNDKCTRAQIVTFQYRMANSPSVNGVSPFTDVPPTLYYANAVAWAVENGITSGTSASTFGPHNDCSRGQIVTFLYRDSK